MFMKEKYKQKKCEKGRGGGEKGEKKNKRRRDSLDLGGSGLSHFGRGFPKVLREWILGFGGRKERRQRGSSRESYRCESCTFLPFLLDSACICL